MVKVSRKSTKSRRVTPLRKRGGSSNKFQGGGVAGAASSVINNKNKNQPSTVSDTKDVVKKNVTKKGVTKPVSYISKEVVKKGAPKIVSRVGSKFIPGVGWVSLGADLLKLGFKAKSKAYQEMDERSPGTSKHLETGAYGQQTSDSGHKVRGTFFSAMKKRGGLIKRKYNEGGNVDYASVFGTATSAPTNPKSKKKFKEFAEDTKKSYETNEQGEVLHTTSSGRKLTAKEFKSKYPAEWYNLNKGKSGSMGQMMVDQVRAPFRKGNKEILAERTSKAMVPVKALGYIPTPPTVAIGAAASGVQNIADASLGKDVTGGVIETAVGVLPGFKQAKGIKDVGKHLIKKGGTKLATSKLKRGGLIMKKHRKKHSAKHIKVMKEEMAKGKSFDKAHIVAIKRVGR